MAGCRKPRPAAGRGSGTITWRWQNPASASRCIATARALRSCSTQSSIVVLNPARYAWTRRWRKTPNAPRPPPSMESRKHPEKKNRCFRLRKPAPRYAPRHPFLQRVTMLDQIDLMKLIFGRLSWDAIPYHVPILLATFAMVAIGGVAALVALTRFRLWGPVWRDWITSIDHKKIGSMYMVLGLVMLLRGVADALMMRAQQAVAFGAAAGLLTPHHYDQIYTAHGVIKIFFVAMPLVTGLMNYVVPLQIGARDVAFPFLNNFSFWMTTFGAGLTMVSLFVGEFARTGWHA